ncbi:hypothetical protein [Litchfieldia alkalitelluris]|uniref:hypothetical protein n=1 Tax=Litchfieldia alkalitelluris TaxID=304268 RepID=UPI0009971B6B|nr:hypothetical protein [Litchfieldia alkalitelluris]
MKEIVILIAELVNDFHDVLLRISTMLGWNLTDKELHLWVLGMIGITMFLVVDVTFKYVSKWSITFISFIYTFTVLFVIVFAIEIQQKITGRGNMEFLDAIIGIWGFLLFFAAYLLIRTFHYFLKVLLRKNQS